LFKHLEQRVREVATGVASALRASIKIEFEMSYPPSVCDPEMAEQLAASSRSLVGAESVFESRPENGREDFSFVLQKVPGAMLWLGVKKRSGRSRSRCTLPPSISTIGAALGSSTLAGLRSTT